jgi:hypothetical protein
MIVPGSLPLHIVTGIIFGPVKLTPKDANNQGVDLTGWKVFAEARKKPGGTLFMDLQPVFTSFSPAEIMIPKLTDEQTYDLKVGEYSWDLILEDPFGDRRGPYLTGPFTITAIITKPPGGP